MFDLVQFHGLSPRTHPRLMRDGMATQANDVNLLHGNLAPKKQPLWQGAYASAGTRAMYRHCEQWLFFKEHRYFAVHPNINDEHGRLYIAGAGMLPTVRNCDGQETSLVFAAPTEPLTLAIANAGFNDYVFRFTGFYEDLAGNRYDDLLITVTEIKQGFTYELAATVRDQAPDEATFCLLLEVLDPAGVLLGVVYSSNSLRVGHSDLYLDGNKVRAKLVGLAADQTETDYSEGVPPAILRVHLSYDESDSINQARSYVYTYVGEFGEESAPSPPSEMLLIENGTTVMISGFQVPVSQHIEKLRVYRTDSAGQFRFVIEFTAPFPADYTDNVQETALGELIPSANWQAVPSDLLGIIAMPNGFMAGFTRNHVYFSVINQPHAFLVEYAISHIDGDIVGICRAYDNALLVATTQHPYLITGYSPDAMTATKAGAVEPCVSPYSLVDMGQRGVGYVTRNGFLVVSAGTPQLITKSLFTPEQWRDLKPETMRCIWYQETLHIVSDVGHWVFAFSEGNDLLTTESIKPSSLWLDVDDDVLWLVDHDKLMQYGKGAISQALQWRSDEKRFAKPISPIKGYIETDQQDVFVRLQLYAEQAQVFNQVCRVNEAFYFPVLPRSQYWSLHIHSDYAVNRVVVSSQHRSI